MFSTDFPSCPPTEGFFGGDFSEHGEAGGEVSAPLRTDGEERQKVDDQNKTSLHADEMRKPRGRGLVRKWQGVCLCKREHTCLLASGNSLVCVSVVLPHSKDH